MGEKMRVKYVHKSQLKHQKLLADGEAHAKHFNEAEIHKRALADPDAQPLTIEQLGTRTK